MIKFECIRYKNILAAGETFIEISLDSVNKTLVVGRNGSGKTLMMDVLCYSLFNKPFRDISLPQLVNSVNNKNLLTEVEFSIGNHSYKVRRGMKPKVFEIIKNGVLIDQDSDAREYQKLLENVILQMNYKSFTQVVLLGSSSYTPFMKLKPDDRRCIIEDILDIGVFSKMNILAKQKFKIVKKSLYDHAADLKNTKITLESKEEVLNVIVSNNSNNTERIESSIKSYNDDLKPMKNYIKEYNEELIVVGKELEKFSDTLDDDLRKLLDIQRDMRYKIKTIDDDIEYYKSTDTCSVCKMAINPHIKAEKLCSLKDNKVKYTTKFEKLVSAVTEVTIESSKRDDVLDKRNKIDSKILIVNSDIGVIKKQISALMNELESSYLTVNTDNKVSEIRELKSKLKELEINNNKLMDDKYHLDIIQKILKDDGIKSLVIKNYLPTINKTINDYLSLLNLFVGFELDETFSEIIKSRYRDEFSYSSFSEGEKFRIDVSLLLAWREVARLKNSVSTNLLILDEIFDSSLDDDGVSDFMLILNKLVGDSNIIVISHKGDSIHDYFDRVLQFSKVGNFSRLKELA